MDIMDHLLILQDIFSCVLQSYSYCIILKALFCHCISIFVPCCIVFGALYYIRLRKPPASTVDRILGSKWGAYGNETPVHEAIKVIGHRCCGLDAPENSLSALQRMISKGIKMVEFDVVMTLDQIPVVFHDDNLTRITDLHRRVSEVPYSEIQKLDISAKHAFGKIYPNERIPSLQEFVDLCIEKNIKMIIDVKCDTAEMIKAINDMFRNIPEMYNMAIISCFNPIVVYRIRANDPNIVASLCWRPYFYSHEEFNEKGPLHPRTTNPFLSLYQRFLNILHYWFLFKIGYYIAGVSVILLDKAAITREDISYWKKRGIRAIAWTVNLPSEKVYFENNLQITYLTDTAVSR